MCVYKIYSFDLMSMFVMMLAKFNINYVFFFLLNTLVSYSFLFDKFFFFRMFTQISSIPNLNLTQIKPQEWIAKRRETLKPWGEFFSTGKFSKPVGVKQATSRLVKNIEYFQSNYLFVFIGLAIYCM